MNALGEALDVAAANLYGRGYDKLPPSERAVLRERCLPIMNALLPRLRETFAQMVDERANANEIWKRHTAAEALREAAQAIRTWSK